MNEKDTDTEDYRSLLVLDEISRSDKLTQRDLSKKLGVALGLVNSYIKNLVSKGYITVSTIPRNRYKYYLTPKGFAEKTRLTYRHLQNFTSLYRVARKDFSILFSKLKAQGVAVNGSSGVYFCGLDEVTEIAYLSLKETGLELAGIADDDSAGADFFGHRVDSIKKLSALSPGVVVITSFAGGGELRKRLLAEGIDPEKICDISAEGWIKRINNIEDSVDEV